METHIVSVFLMSSDKYTNPCSHAVKSYAGTSLRPPSLAVAVCTPQRQLLFFSPCPDQLLLIVELDSVSKNQTSFLCLAPVQHTSKTSLCGRWLRLILSCHGTYRQGLDLGGHTSINPDSPTNGHWATQRLIITSNATVNSSHAFAKSENTG